MKEIKIFLSESLSNYDFFPGDFKSDFCLEKIQEKFFMLIILQCIISRQ